MALKQRNIAAIREAYHMGHLVEHELAADAMVQFGKWFDEALAQHVMEPNAMTLATASSSGSPSARIVLLKDVSDSGFSFFTNYESRKGDELAENPHAALLFFWPELQRQVRVEGLVERLPVAASEAYFQSRPKGSKLGAIVSPQSREIASRDVLDDQLATLERAYAQQDVIPKPAHWGGYLLVPSRIEFWQGRDNRLHDRLVYRRVNNDWEISRLAP